MISGLRVLVVEDEAVVAFDIGEMIREAEGKVVGPFASVREARAILKDNAAVDAAVLDVNLSDGKITPVLESLRAFRLWSTRVERSLTMFAAAILILSR